MKMTTKAAEADALFYPMDEFYAAQHRPLPALERIEGEMMPQPYQSLLVHKGDMTPTLERHHGGRISLKLFDRRLGDDGWLTRWVALVLDDGGRRVELGAIRINLNLFSAEARRHILEGRRPLGTILNEDGISHISRPVAYFRVRSDELLNESFGLTGAHMLYGRRNVLYNNAGEPLAEVVEILPPME